MKDTKTNIIINDLIYELNQKYPDFRGIYLFGSRARGDFNEDSDYDLAIIFNREIDNKPKREISDVIAFTMLKYEVIIDNPVFSINDLVDPITPLRENIVKEGIFYAAA